MRTSVLDATSADLFAALIPGVTVIEVEQTPTSLLLTALALTLSAACPRCGTASTRVHSYYTRRPRDLPVCGLSVRLLLHVRRFRCLLPTCPAVTFTERLPELLAPAAQRTNRLNDALRELALAFGGEAGARQSARSAMPASSDTLLRRAHTATPPVRPTPRVVGIDDFAFQKGRVYGTILTDGETHAVVDLLPDRTPETVAAWFEQHPGVELVTRDRSKEYARGISAGAPDAVQVADRWHVLGNLREALERLLDRLRPQLLALPQAADAELPLGSTDRDRRRGTLDQVRQQASRERRYARYAEVKRLQAEDTAIIQIARELKLSRQTVRKYMASDSFPEHARPRQQRSILDSYVGILQERWDAGCHENKELLEAIRAAGYQGSIRPVVQWTMLRRRLLPGYQPPGRRPARPVELFVPPAEHAVPQQGAQSLPASRRLVWLLFHFPDQLEPQKVGVLAWGIHDNRVFTELAELSIGLINGQLSEIPDPTTEQIAPSASTLEPNAENEAEATSAAPVAITVTGQFQYNDHATRLIGLDPTPTLRPIRRARVQLQYWVETDFIWYTYDQGITYTDNNGGFTLTTSVAPDPDGQYPMVRGIVCTVGPEPGDQVQVRGGTGGVGAYHCWLSRP